MLLRFGFMAFEYPQRVQFTDPVKAQPLMQFQENLRRALKPLKAR